MDEILERYNQGKFQKCLELIKLLPPGESMKDNFIIQNCSLICNSVISILEKNPAKQSEAEEQLYLFFDTVISLASDETTISLRFKLTVIFNFYWWLLFYGDKELDEEECEEFFKVVNLGICKVVGLNEESAAYQNMPEKIIESLNSLKDSGLNNNSCTMLLIVEIIIVVLMYIIKHRKDCLKLCSNAISKFLSDVKDRLDLIQFEDEMPSQDKNLLDIMKFSLNKTTSNLFELNSSVIGHFYILESVMLTILGNYQGSLTSIQKNLPITSSSLCHYLGALNSLKLCKRNLCLNFITKIEPFKLPQNMRMRFLILHGKYCALSNSHKDALKHFEEACSISKYKSPVPLYHLGSQWGLIGVYDKMVETFEKLLEVIESECEEEDDLNLNFEKIVLKWIHADEEITENEALYALAVAYGLNERFQESADTFERLQEQRFARGPIPDVSDRVIATPNWITVLHEASVMNLLAGNLTKSEEIALEAVDVYRPKDPPTRFNETQSLLDKDVVWLQKTIEEELLENDVSVDGQKSSPAYSEDLVYFLPENVIALLIIAEIQRIQKADEHTVTLKRIFSCFSTYLASILKKGSLDEAEKQISYLVKVLAGKTCLRIAQVQVENKNFSSVDKMFKRALSCNKGDKDVLYSYCKFLLENGRKADASKLWRAFYNETFSVPIDSVQSLTLKFFLTPKVNLGDLEKLERALDMV